MQYQILLVTRTSSAAVSGSDKALLPPSVAMQTTVLSFETYDLAERNFARLAKEGNAITNSFVKDLTAIGVKSAVTRLYDVVDKAPTKPVGGKTPLQPMET